MNENFKSFHTTDEYQKHVVFKQLNKYVEFYDLLSSSVLKFITMGVTGQVFNIDTYFYSSIQGTLDSIKIILLKGRINDAYALLRKYWDSVLVNTYTILFLDANSNIEDFVVKKIDDWVKGKEELPDSRSINSYISDSKRIAHIKEILYKDAGYEKLRKKCNDHMHYNFFHTALVNNGDIYLTDRVKMFDQFSKDLRSIFILHFAYLFTINQHYMSSSDYGDSMDMGLEPEEGSQYYVAPFIQEIFDNEIRKYRPDIAEEIKCNTSMKLE